MNGLPTAALDLRDIHAAAAPGWWPPAPGWWVLGVLALVVLLLLARWTWRRVRAARRQRRILAALDTLATDTAAAGMSAFLAALSALLRRVALRRYDRARVAPLSGIDWLRFLDATGGEGAFEHGAGRALADGAYRPETDPVARDELLDLARRWILHNLEAAR